MDLRPFFANEELRIWDVSTPEGTHRVTQQHGEQQVLFGADEIVLDEAALLQKLAGLQIRLVDSLGQPVFGPPDAG